MSLNELHFFSVSRPGEDIEMEAMSPNTTNQDHDAVKNLDEIVAENGFENMQMVPMTNPNCQSQEQKQESGGEIIKMAPMSPNPNHEQDNHTKAHMEEKLTRKISEPLIESDTTFSNGEKCCTNTCLETVQEASENTESEGKNFF